MNDEMFKKLSAMLESTKKSGNSFDFNSHSFKENFDNIMSNFASNNNQNNNYNGFDFSNIDVETISKIQNIMSKMASTQHSPRSNLLSSLKPYLKPSRQEKLDQYMQFINMVSILETFNNVGGDN